MRADHPTELYVFGSFDSGHQIHPDPYAPTVRDLWNLLDGPLPPGPQVEGEIARHDVKADGWSYVSWWDRRGDNRGGSHTGILARGKWTHAQLVAAGRDRYPWAFRVPLGRWAGVLFPDEVETAVRAFTATGSNHAPDVLRDIFGRLTRDDAWRFAQHLWSWKEKGWSPECATGADLADYQTIDRWRDRGAPPPGVDRG